MKPIKLPLLVEAAEALNRSANYAAGGLVDASRDSASIALQAIAEALGVNERGRELMRALIVTAETGGVPEYDRLHDHEREFRSEERP